MIPCYRIFQKIDDKIKTIQYVETLKEVITEVRRLRIEQSENISFKRHTPKKPLLILKDLLKSRGVEAKVSYDRRYGYLIEDQLLGQYFCQAVEMARSDTIVHMFKNEHL